MKFTIAEAATRLGKSERQIRILIQKGRLAAAKVEGKWQIDEGALPVSPAATQAAEVRAEVARDALERAVAPATRGKFFSVTDLLACTPRAARHGPALVDDHAEQRQKQRRADHDLQAQRRVGRAVQRLDQAPSALLGVRLADAEDHRRRLGEPLVQGAHLGVGVGCELRGGGADLVVAREAREQAEQRRHLARRPPGPEGR